MIMGRGHSVIMKPISNSLIRSVLDVKIENLKKYQEIGPTTTRLAGTEGATIFQCASYLPCHRSRYSIVKIDRALSN